MPNPFSSKTPEEKPPSSAVGITNSTLICEKCFEEVTNGVYLPDNKTLYFTCSNNHDNEVKGIEI